MNISQMRGRTSYVRFREFLSVVSEANVFESNISPPDISKVMWAAFSLVEAYRGFGSQSGAAAASESIRLILDEHLISSTHEKDLPTLLGHKFYIPEIGNDLEGLLAGRADAKRRLGRLIKSSSANQATQGTASQSN